MSENYLRVRGEYGNGHGGNAQAGELPPRARRIPGWAIGLDKLPGTTSACAENTTRAPKKLVCAGNYLRVRGEYQGHGILPGRWGNYLRVRGEYTNATAGLMCYGELPPRARRIHGVLPKEITTLGTTSACAENTASKLE